MVASGSVPWRRASGAACALLGLLVVCASLLSGCAQDVGLIDRSQPGLIPKHVFEGEWLMRRTVIDVPYDAAYTFIGEQEAAVRITWDIQRDYLVAYRVNPHVEGTPDAAPAAVFAIKAHVDLQREYNPATGEQNNVLVENTTDRMWFDRGWVRIDWSKNLVTNFDFYVDQLDLEPIGHYIEDPSDPDALTLGVRDGEGGWTDVTDPREIRDLEAADYLDVVTRVFVRPEEMAWDDGWGNIVYEPACWYYLSYDCAPGAISIRNSFLRMEHAASDYAPLSFPDNHIVRDGEGEAVRVAWDAEGNRVRVETSSGEAPPADASGNPQREAGPDNPYDTGGGNLVRMGMLDKFGFFRTERFGYDPLYGETESRRNYMVNRWNIWARTHDESGNELPYAERQTRPIVYYLSPDFPEDLKAAANSAVDQWNEAFVDTVEALGAKVDGRMVELRENTGQRIGDLRYSHVYLVLQPTRAGLLGYGPSAADPLTGEIVAADAFVYAGPIAEVAAKGADIVDLLNGKLDPAVLAEGDQAQRFAARFPLEPASAGPTPDEAKAFARDHQHASPSKSAKPGGKKASAQPPRRYRNPAAHLKALPGIDKLRRPAGWGEARLAHVRGTPVEDLLIGDSQLVGMKTGGLVEPGTGGAGLPAGLRDRVSPATWSSRSHKKRVLERFRSFAKRNILMASFVDDAVAGLAAELKDLPREEVQARLVEHIFRSTTEHEIGHTLGLSHNFEASTDALNYHPEYWDLRGESPEPMAEMTDKERDGRLREYQYSSIMDYHGRFNTDTAGIGYYDRAAIKFGYGQLVEVFEEAPDEPLVGVLSYDDGTSERPFTLDEVFRRFRHYTKLPSILGGTAGIAKRRDVPYTKAAASLMGMSETESLEAQLTGDAPWTLWEVPYRFCADEYVFGTKTCYAFDLGADGYEIVRDTIARYENYYWFNNFKRDRVFFDEWDYMDSMYWRYFGYLQNTYQNWVFDQWFTADTWEWARGYAGELGVEDAPWEEAADAGLSDTAAVMEAVRFLWRVVATPEPGAYMYDFDEGYYWSFAEAGLPVCEQDWAFYTDEWCTDVNVELGQGRWFDSVYDWESGYFFYERLKWIGSFYDKLLALETMATPDTWFLGIDTSSGVDEWAISMNLSFPNELQKLFSGMAADRFELFAGVVEEDGFTYVPPDPFATGADAQVFADNGPMDPGTSFTMQLYALWYGMAWFNANYDNSFNDGAKIWLKGSGEGLEPADPTQLVEVADPFNGRVYVALRSEDAGELGVGATMLDRAQHWLDQYDAALVDPELDPSWADYYRYQFEATIENVEVVRGLYDLYGYLYF